MDENPIAKQACIYRHPSTAVADVLSETEPTPDGLLNVVSTTFAQASGPCTPSQRHLDDLATNDVNKCRLIAGVDEAGRGPLAGSVVAAAVILDERHPISGLTDSKRLSASRREALEIEIKCRARAWAVAESSHQEVDEINILQASLLAMKRALLGLNLKPEHVLVDGNRLPSLDGYTMQAIVKGDLSEPCISAASILAKQYRDRQMLELDRLYPEYQFARHKGYPTVLHRQLLCRYGVSPVHRRSFKPVRELL